VDELEERWPDTDRQVEALARIAERLEGRSRRNTAGLSPRRRTLSEPELNTLRALAAGLNRQETADVLGYSLEGVKSHLKNVRRLLRAKTNAHAVAEGFRRHLLT
jgi:DNA-binding CsgD family transcriptional regulator